jgi:hypothetical protein
MALPSSGTISFDDLQTEFGGTHPISLAEFYKGGALVPSTPANAGVPTSGTISLDDFHGASGAGGGGGGVSASISPTAVFGSGTGTVSTNVATATGTGGTVTGYSWTRIAGDSAITAFSPTGHSTAFQGNVSAVNDFRSATFRCTITFSGGATATDTVDASISYDSGA